MSVENWTGAGIDCKVQSLSFELTKKGDQNVPFSLCSTLGQKTTFYPKIIRNLMLEKCVICEK